MIEFSNTFRTVFLTFILFASASVFSAQQEGGQARNPSAKAQALAQKRAQFEQDAAAAIPEVETEFTKFISYINTGRIPDDANVNAGLKFISRTRKFLPVFNKQRKAATYNALSAWVYYFDNKQDKVQKLVAAGIKDTGQNINVIRTNLALSMIYKDYESVSQVIASAASENSASANQEYSYQSAENTLNLDVNSIRSNLLGKIFNIRPASPDKDILCLLLWKLDPNELDRFAPQEPKPAEANDPNIPVQEPLYSGDSGINEVKPTQGVYEFSKLQNQFANNKKTVFMGINFNDPTKTKNIEKWMAENPQSWQVTAPSAALQQKITSFLGTTKLDKPMLLITSPDSTIRYVGDVNCFLPNMIIQNILANPQEFIEPNEPNKLNEPNEPNKPALQAPAVIDTPIKILTPSAEPNILPQQTPAVKEAQQSPQQIQVQSSPPPAPAVIDNDFFDPQAETLLENARAFFKIGNRLQYHTYAKPIEMCRRVIKDYPNTKYAEQARILMRNVPERYRERYQITNEELGL